MFVSSLGCSPFNLKRIRGGYGRVCSLAQLMAYGCGTQGPRSCSGGAEEQLRACGGWHRHSAARLAGGVLDLCVGVNPV